jgi:hypothetical protein
VAEPDGWERVERAEARLDQRARERDRQRRRRRIWMAIVRWSAAVVLPVAGSAVGTALLEAAGGDLRDFSDGESAALVIVALLWPAVLAGWLWRRRGIVTGLGVALGVLFAQIGLTLGVAFTLLGYGPE